MNFAEYQPLAMRTAVDLGRYKGTQHASLGLTTEAGELCDMIKRNIAYGKPLDNVNAIEEVGDIMWYLALLADTYGETLGNLEIDRRTLLGVKQRMAGEDLATIVLAIAHMCAQLVDVSVEDEVTEGTHEYTHGEVQALLTILAAFCLRMNSTIEYAMDRNIAKLQKRFPEKFSADRALNRDLAAEREVLEVLSDGGPALV
jgi:NTP pyrophosphatase (non-canonical NTP hydrolase)